LNTENELKRLKKDYLELDRLFQEEKELLIRVINVLGSVVPSDAALRETVDDLRKLLVPGDSLDQDRLRGALDRLRSMLMGLEEGPGGASGSAEAERLHGRLVEACRVLRRVMMTLLEGFYPLSPELTALAGEIDLDCSAAGPGPDLDGPSEKLLLFLERLKDDIAGDFREVHGTLFVLLEQVKELEAGFTREFGEEGGRIKRLEYFELKVNNEVGAIAGSFDVHTTVSEIRQAVIRKIENIKELVSLRKREELERMEAFQKSVQALKTRIEEVERDALEMSRRAEEFEAAAMKDELTGLYNRKAFDSRLKNAIERFNAGKSPFALILFDIDRFKNINDDFGHVAGDKVLRKMGKCLRDTFRKNDFIARYGGDEFVILIEDLSRDLARDKIMAFMKNLQRLRFTSHSRGDIDVGVSPGVAMVRAGDTPESLLERADRAMYDVKNKRR
jgi:diguanylate cyclase